MGNNGAGCVCLQKDGFVEEMFNGGLEKMASEMA
jgi:hypothetical protein